MHLLCCLFFIRARYNIYLHAVCIEGERNVLADAISRDRLPFLFSQVPQAEAGRTLLPLPLCTLLVHSHPDWTSPLLFSASLAASTKKSYNSGCNRYHTFLFFI